MLWLLSPVRATGDSAVLTLALPAPSSSEAKDGCGECRALPAQPWAAIPVPRHVQRRILAKDVGSAAPSLTPKVVPCSIPG